MASMTRDTADCSAARATWEFLRLVEPPRSVRVKEENATAMSSRTASMPRTMTRADPERGEGAGPGRGRRARRSGRKGKANFMKGVS